MGLGRTDEAEDQIKPDKPGKHAARKSVVIPKFEATAFLGKFSEGEPQEEEESLVVEEPPVLKNPPVIDAHPVIDAPIQTELEIVDDLKDWAFEDLQLAKATIKHNPATAETYRAAIPRRQWAMAGLSLAEPWI